MGEGAFMKRGRFGMKFENLVGLALSGKRVVVICHADEVERDFRHDINGRTGDGTVDASLRMVSFESGGRIEYICPPPGKSMSGDWLSIEFPFDTAAVAVARWKDGTFRLSWVRQR
jgi:hypothetical protein